MLCIDKISSIAYKLLDVCFSSIKHVFIEESKRIKGQS
ncbi:hypothetical protein BGAPBR_K0039 (plasmid) [Borreliella garinii PBr]|uniref:Uncharacterized protein n=1 Tax=Borreliella garinii PBr TaxID=498743 RepID=B8F0S2_BORGR|nr:hypothetical protein BGAPBR_K0039 [Borreliella garinii PBr]